jgi:hypothetical protein
MCHAPAALRACPCRTFSRSFDIVSEFIIQSALVIYRFAARLAKTHAERKKVLSVSRRQKWWPSKKKANWAPGPCANFQEITMENMPVLPLEES